MIVLSNGPGLIPPKPFFWGEKRLTLLEIFWVKNFSKLVRVRASNLYRLLIGVIKAYHYYNRCFLLRPLVSEIFAGPFHQAKAVSSSFTFLGVSEL